MDDLIAVSGQSTGGDFVTHVEIDAPVYGEMLHERRDVLREHLARMIGNLRRKICGAKNCDPVLDNALVGLRQLAVAAPLRSQVNDDTAAGHSPYGVGRDQQRRLPSGNRGRGDDNVAIGHHRRHQLALFIIELIAHRLGVPAFVFGCARFKLEFDELCSEALDLFTNGRTHVVCLNHRSKSPRRGNRLKASDSRANHNTRAGDNVPAAVIISGNIFGNSTATRITARYPATQPIELSTSMLWALVIRGINSSANSEMPRSAARLMNCASPSGSHMPTMICPADTWQADRQPLLGSPPTPDLSQQFGFIAVVGVSGNFRPGFLIVLVRIPGLGPAPDSDQDVMPIFSIGWTADGSSATDARLDKFL